MDDVTGAIGDAWDTGTEKLGDAWDAGVEKVGEWKDKYVDPVIDGTVEVIKTGFEAIGEATVATVDAVASVVNGCESDSPTRPADEVSCSLGDSIAVQGGPQQYNLSQQY